MMDKRILAPVVVTIVLVLYFTGFLVVAVNIIDPLWVKIVGSVVPLILMGVSVYVLVERVKEIRGGEEDDLSKY
ncbi:MAG: hypothetical protein GX974_07560 [Clostridiales bacterium]|nr:hypothetical protein [Clostridiales bacterium]